MHRGSVGYSVASVVAHTHTYKYSNMHTHTHAHTYKLECVRESHSHEI